MSVAVKDSLGRWVQVAGQGKAEYGASTERKGDVTVPATTAGNHQSVSVVFAQAMPDNDYTVVIDEGSDTWAHCTVNVTNKTATGFTLFFLNVAGQDAPQMTFKYRAFKLYTDTEYNSLLDLPDRVETLETVTSGNISGATTNSGTITNATYARSGNVVQLRLTLTDASLTTHSTTTLVVTMPSTVPVPVMTVDGVANAWNGSVDETGHVRMSSGSRDVVIYSSNDSETDEDITGADVWATVTYITQ